MENNRKKVMILTNHSYMLYRFRKELIEELMKNYDRIFQKAEAELRSKYTEEQLDLFGDILETISGYNWRKLTDEQ